MIKTIQLRVKGSVLRDRILVKIKIMETRVELISKANPKMEEECGNMLELVLNLRDRIDELKFLYDNIDNHELCLVEYENNRKLL